MQDLRVEYVPVNSLTEYEGNAKIHTAEQIEQIKESIQEFGMNDPIAVWKDNVIIEGHGRLLACKELGIEKVPVIRLEHMNDEQRRAYVHVHNKLTMNTDFDLDILGRELDDILGIDMTLFGFGGQEEPIDEGLNDDTYTRNVNIPQYEITGENVTLDDLVGKDKTHALIEQIRASKVSENEKQFLIDAAQRHLVFNYHKIAEYYAKASPEMQELMEASALVIIDYEDAIRNGYVNVTDAIYGMSLEDDDDA